MTTVPTAQSRTAGELIRDPMFGPYVTGNIMSSCGNWVQQIAAAVLMFQLTRSAFMVGARRQQREGASREYSAVSGTCDAIELRRRWSVSP